MFLAASGLLGSCATVEFGQDEHRVLVSEVIRMTREGMPPDIIVKQMRDSKTVYRLTATQLVLLHDQGIADPVIDYMQETYLGAGRREQNLADWNTREMWSDHF
jgi:hypothetical protein